MPYLDCNALEALANFRDGVYACFPRGKDALMNVCDALLTETQARSFIELSLSPFFTRRWPSLYEALDDGVIDRQTLQRQCVAIALWLLAERAGRQSGPAAGADETRPVLVVDASAIPRPEARTARDRSYVHVPSPPAAAPASPIAVPAWQFSTVAFLPSSQNPPSSVGLHPSSWTMILDNRRVPSDQTPCQIAAQQLTELSPKLPRSTVFLGDGSFGTPHFLTLVAELPQGKLLRTACNRVLYRPAPPPTGKVGRPRKDGERFAFHDSATWGPPDEQWSGENEQGQDQQVLCWHHLHFQQARSIPVTVLRLERSLASSSNSSNSSNSSSNSSNSSSNSNSGESPAQSARERRRNPPVLWLIWQGEPSQMPPLCEIPGLYRLRYSIEHSYRFDKQALLWAEPRLRTPEKFERWTQLVSIVHNEITLARYLPESVLTAVRRPWERWERGRREPTPQQVRRGFPGILAQLGTPAALPKPRGNSPGRAPGATIRHAERHPVIYKQTSKKKKPVETVV
jgi:hypothetical protein